MSDSRKVVLITGSSSGIGKACALLFATKGYRVAIHGNTQSKVDDVVAECLTKSSGHVGFCLNFFDTSNCALLVKKTLDHFERIDILVNNAGIAKKTFIDDEEANEKCKQMMTVNYFGTVETTLAALPTIKKNKGNIVFVSSIAATKPLRHRFGYCASKVAMAMFAKSLAINVAPDIRINIVSPGPIVSDINRDDPKPSTPESIATSEKARATFLNTLPARRVGYPEEVARAVYFLTDENNAYCYGTELLVDGGALLDMNLIH